MFLNKASGVKAELQLGWWEADLGKYLGTVYIGKRLSAVVLYRNKISEPQSGKLWKGH